MTDEEKWELFLEIHSRNPQEGPGDSASTRRAFSMLDELPPEPRILDAGCGPGRQTRDLCRLTDGKITAVDLHQPYLDKVNAIVPKDRVITMVADMADLPFDPESFDLIWSEGAIYNIGFFQGLEKWLPMLGKNGFVAVTELTWLKSDLPKELETYWKEAYPQMQNLEQNLADFERAGYRPVGHFTLPESAWWDYYRPAGKRVLELKGKYAGNPEAQEILDAELAEQEIYRNYSDWYGYVFYIGQAI